MRRPLLVLDVDGVLNPFAAARCPAGFVEHDLFAGEEPVRLCAAHGRWIRRLATRYDITWATGWGPAVNSVLAPLLGLPAFPVIGLPAAPFPPSAKVPAIAAYAADRAVAWVDDAHPPSAEVWSADRAAPTLLVPVAPEVGLTWDAVVTLLAWPSRWGLP